MLKKFFFFVMWYPLRFLIAHLPHSLVYRIGLIGGRLLYLISREKHGIMLQELKTVFPGRDENDLKRTVRGGFANYVLSEMEVLLYPLLRRELIEKLFDIEGRQHLDQALAEGRGVLLFQAHFGAFQMTMPAVGYSGYRMNQISAPATIWKEAGQSKMQSRSYEIKAEHEYTLPVKHIDVQSSMRPVFRALQANEIVGVTVDGGGGKKVTTVDFLGRKANFQQGAADLALRTGAVVVPVFIITTKGLRHRLVIHRPIEPDPAGDGGREEEIRQIMQRFASILEEYVCRHPDHYLYTLYLRRARAGMDTFPFFKDYNDGNIACYMNPEKKAEDHE